MKLNKGFSAIEGVLVVGVVAIIGALGWTFYMGVMNQQGESVASNTSVQSIPEVNSSADLQKVEDAVNAIDIDESVDTTDVTEALQ